jgi:alkylation response protein AidB-like acyl-CoA dehydrogenase
VGILREPVGPSPRAVEYVERARSLRPLLEACAEEGERERRLVAAFLAADVAREVFGDRRALLAWGPGPGARAVAVDGGYRVTGTWSLASGCRHATWLGGHCPIVDTAGVPRRGRDGAPEARVMLMPADRATLVDVWHVSGLRGTGSDAFLVEDLFVPREFSVARDSPAERRHPGPLYCFPTGSFYASGFAGVALGIAGAMLEAFVALAGEKSPRGFKGLLRESAVVQAQVAQAEAALRSARLYLLASLAEVWASVGRVGALDLEQRVLIRLAASHAIQAARSVGDTVHLAAGATAIFTSSAFERRFRDLHAVTQQMQGRLAHFETVGQFLLGLEPDTAWL